MPVYFFVSMAAAWRVYILQGQSYLTLPIQLFSVSNLILEVYGLQEVYSGFK